MSELLGGRYQIERQLGKGGFGETHLARDTHLPKQPYCVVKHLRPIYGNPQVLEIAKRLFNQEAETLSELGEHPQIPRLYAYFTQGEDFYLVQEFVDGHGLEQELQTKWTPEAVGEFIAEMMEILRFVHGKGVIHRDIKPANILRRKHDNKLVLIDFGAIKAVSQSAMLESGLMTASIAIGTAGYTAPEQACGNPRFSSDIYSVGMIAIQALTGKNIRDLGEDSHTGELAWREFVASESQLLDIVSKMTKYMYKERYRNVEQVLTDLEQLRLVVIPQPTPVRNRVTTPQKESQSEPSAKNQSEDEPITKPQPTSLPIVDVVQEQTIPETQLVDSKATSLMPIQAKEIALQEYEVQVARQIQYGMSLSDETIRKELDSLRDKLGISYSEAEAIESKLVNAIAKKTAPNPAKPSLKKSQNQKRSFISVWDSVWSVWDSVWNLLAVLGGLMVVFMYYAQYHASEQREIFNYGLESAKKFYDTKEYTKAIEKVDELLDRELDMVEAYVLRSTKARAYSLRGRAKYSLGNRQDGIDDLEKAVQLDASEGLNISPFLVVHANDKYLLKDYQGAIADYTKAIELSSKDDSSRNEYYNNRGDAKYALKDYQGAIEDYTKAIELMPYPVYDPYYYSEYYNNRGNAKYALKDYQGAIADYTKAIELNPAYDFFFYNYRGNAKYALKDYRGAIADYTKAIELNPNYANAYNNRGYAKYALKDYRGAIADYDKAIQLDPTDAEYFFRRGMAKSRLGDKFGARKDLTKARQMFRSEGQRERVSAVDSWLKDL